MKNENEKNELVLLLINNFYEYNLKFPFEDEKTDKYLEFIEESSEEDKFDLFINDNEFNLDIMFVTIESMEQNNSYNSVTFINELYRKFVIDFSNFNFEIGYLETESHKLINYFLKNNFNIDENIYNNNPIVINCNDKNFKTILKLIIISDYYKLNFSVKDEENYISETDLKYLEIINKSSINDLLKFFDISDDFSLKAIEDFILLNEYLQNNYNKSKVDEKTLKKINPFYILDKITEKKDI